MTTLLLLGLLLAPPRAAHPADPVRVREAPLSLALTPERDRYPVHSAAAFWLVAENAIDEPSNVDLALNPACETVRFYALRGSTEILLSPRGSLDLECAKVRLDAHARWGVRIVVALDPTNGDFLLATPGEYRFVARYRDSGVVKDTDVSSITVEPPRDEDLPAYRAFETALASLAQVPRSGGAPLTTALVDRGIAYVSEFSGSQYAEQLLTGLKDAIASLWASATPEQRSAWSGVRAQPQPIPDHGLERDAHAALTPQLELIIHHGEYGTSGEGRELPIGAYEDAIDYARRFGGTSYARRVRVTLEVILLAKENTRRITAEERALLDELRKRR